MWLYLETGSLRKHLRLNKAVRVGLRSSRINASWEETPESSLFLSPSPPPSVPRQAGTKERPREDSEKVTICNPQGQFFPTLLASCTWASSLRSCENINYCKFLSHSVCKILLRSPRRMRQQQQQKKTKPKGNSKNMTHSRSGITFLNALLLCVTFTIRVAGECYTSENDKNAIISSKRKKKDCTV